MVKKTEKKYYGYKSRGYGPGIDPPKDHRKTVRYELNSYISPIDRNGQPINRPMTVKRARSQTGKTNNEWDERYSAMAPGIRKAKSGKLYSERRKNRSDMPRRRI